MKQAKLKLLIALFLTPFVIWILLPPAPSGDAAGVGVDASTADGKRPYVIKFFPGFQYMPGSIPYGIGTPLKGVTEVIRDFESRFPDTRVEIVAIPGGAREYMVTQLSSGKAPDILMTSVNDVWVDVHKNWYVPLDSFLDAPNDFVREQGDATQPGYHAWWDMFKYQAISRGKVAPDGRYYCISYDMLESGIFYNKTLFRQLGLDVPETWPEFMHVLDTLQRHRGEGGRSVIPLLLVIDNLNDWAVDLFFDQIYHDLLPKMDLYTVAGREAYMPHYLDWDELCFLHEQGYFTADDPRYVELWSKIQQLAGYANRDLAASDVAREFVTQQGAMLWTISSFAYRLSGDPDLGFEWGVFYLPHFTADTAAHATERPMSVIGGAATQFVVTNTAIGDVPETQPFEERIRESQRLQRVVSFLQFLTLPENNRRIVNEYPCFISNVIGVETPEPLRPFEVFLERPYVSTKWIWSFDLKYSEVQSRMLQMMLSGGISLDEFLHDWQVPNIEAACANALMRKPFDRERLETAWRLNASAPVVPGVQAEGRP